MSNKVALVTGAAGGIGSAVVRTLAERQIEVAAVDRDGDHLAQAAKQLLADGLPVRTFSADVTDPESVETMVEAVERQVGPVDFLVNTAGVLRLGSARTLSLEDWSATFAVNAQGVFLVSRAVANRMVPRCRGAIVTVASNAAGTPRLGMAAYSASKAAATMFTKNLGLELAEYGIRCNVVSPGSTDTAMLWSMWQDDSGAQATVEGRLDQYKLGIPLGKLAMPEDIAAAVEFLLSDRAGHITMHALTVDGGATLGG
ncbi:2,3-dihydro-2,3-dihydroxybenzoate dehydrogenase [Jatrophihabitans sp.]|uniref:2,3-dihydro-2,3-dihydroxybenzoate dehydrogenase n=1 Tax=Jatrophihabitans sp. TaxID=1932789 RepID=UPI002BD23E6E|nr:2,3-dihydro-2,3-dihydroxybenzoate dehydrogenase [Jatrophihabitans sp.]